MANPFGDVEEQIDQTRGVLDDEAMRRFDRVVERANPQGEGFDFHVHCTNCGSRNTITLKWPELIVAGCGLVPVDVDSGIPWVSQGGFLYPPVVCGCHTNLIVPLTPDKANRFIQTGISMRRLDPNQVEQHRRAAIARAQSQRR